MAALMPSCASEITSLTLRKPRQGECQIICVRGVREGWNAVGSGIGRSPPSNAWWPRKARVARRVGICEALRHDPLEVHLGDQFEQPAALAGPCHAVGAVGSTL